MNHIDLKALIEDSPGDSGKPIAKQVRHCRDVAMLNTYFGLTDFTYPATSVVRGSSCEFDFFDLPTQTHVKIFRSLDEVEVGKTVRHLASVSSICILDTAEIGLALTRSEHHGVTYLVLEKRPFETAKALNAYLLFEQKLWCCHLGSNLWEPMLPQAARQHPFPSAQSVQ
jgi:hypothetical protein